MTRYSIERTAKKYIKGYRFLSFMRNLSNKFEKNDIGYCYKKKMTRCCNNCFKK